LTFGVRNSHIHHYWMPISYYQRSSDYGYGAVYDYIYGGKNDVDVAVAPAAKQSLTK